MFSTESITFVKEAVDWLYMLLPKIMQNKDIKLYCHHCECVMMSCFRNSLRVKERHNIPIQPNIAKLC